MPPKKKQLFAEAARYCDLDRLYKALADAKRKISPQARKGLTDTEKLYLQGLLCGHSPAEMAELLNLSPKSVEVFVCKTLYQYVKNLVGKPSDEPAGNWRNVLSWLEDAGYKTEPSLQYNFNGCLPTETLVKIVGMELENQNTLTIDINLKLSFAPNSESPERAD